MKQQVVLHPLLFAIYPPVFLYSANWQVFDASVLLIPVAGALLAASTLWYGLQRLCRDTAKSALYASAIIFFLFSYSAIADCLRRITTGGEDTAFSTASMAIFVSFLTIIACAAAWSKLKNHTTQITYIVNLVAMILVVVPPAEVAVKVAHTAHVRDLLPSREQFAAVPLDDRHNPQPPDIYYLVLDGYGRSDFLHREYEFDNSEFITFLESQGFYVAGESTANYPITLVSIASALNFTYWDEVMGDRLKEVRDRRFMREMMQRSRAVASLRSAGYKIVAFDSEYSEASIGEPDLLVRDWWFPNAFQIAWLQMSPLPVILQALDQPVLYDLHRTRVTYPIDTLPEIAQLPGPKFVYFHTFFGHPPFVFGPNGERVSQSWDYNWDDGDKYRGGSGDERLAYVEGYRSQLTYLNKKLLKTIQTILATSKHRPIIVLQGDHGPGSQFSTTSLENTNVAERYSILNALLLPEHGRSQLYQSISPVNTFRVILNTVFGTEYRLLEDKSYYTPFLEPYNYIPVDASQKLVQSHPSSLAGRMTE